MSPTPEPRLGVIGWPVAHSRSPAMHNLALAEVGLGGWRYQLLPVPPHLFSQTVAALPGAGFRGVNVTIPHKQAALSLADHPTSRARAIGAANTLVFDEGGVRADNTDAPALTAELPMAVSGITAVVLGAGGSARAAVWALRDAGAREVWVWNRTPERARALCASLGGVPVKQPPRADVLVNCTAAGLGDPAGSLAALPLSEPDLGGYSCVVDLAYGPQETALVGAARARGVPVIDGLSLLVAQGALSFEQFTGVKAPRDAMRAAARAPVSSGAP
jgi:shikimate dehydrogenase